MPDILMESSGGSQRQKAARLAAWGKPAGRAVGESGSARFRSQGEVQIARLLERNGIRYFYEHPVAVVEEGKTRIWYPDFLMPDYGMLIEYFGRPEDPAYAAGMARKVRVYGDNGLSALFLGPEDLQGNWPDRVLGRIEDELARRLEHFRMSAAGGRPRRSC